MNPTLIRPARVAAYLAILLIAAGPLQSAPKPNVVVFLVDDMGVMDTSLPFLTDPSGRPKTYPLNEYYRTPNMERLAKRGVRFNNFSAMSVCSPTRVSILTGQRRSARPARLELARPKKDRRHTAPSAPVERLPHDPRRQGALRPHRIPGQRTAQSRLRHQCRRHLDRSPRQLLRTGKL
jgi:hypothetical protein